MGAFLQGRENAAWRAVKPQYGDDPEYDWSMGIVHYRNKLKDDARRREYMRAYEAGETFSSSNVDHFADRGVEIPEELYPKTVTLKDNVRIPDYYPKGLVIVSADFRRMLDQFDAGKHQYVPVEIRLADGAPYTFGPYFFFNCRQILNAVVPEGLYCPVEPDYLPEHLWPVVLSPLRDFSMYKDKMNGAGLWKEIRAASSTFVSDAFIAAAKEAGLTGCETTWPFPEA